MTFFDKLFTIKSRNNKPENGYKFAIEPLRSSVFDIAKDQIRVVLFRECDRRGRKLLFDSNAVEKLPLGSHVKAKEFVSKPNHNQTQNGKLFDFVEVTNSHGYKYNKPSNDVTLLGEMIFGSVAMVFKSVNTCKIHCLASPKCVMFTNIVHAPVQCRYQLSSNSYVEANSGPSSGSSMNEYLKENRTSSSDSKLYKTKSSSKCSTSTYPCMKHKTNENSWHSDIPNVECTNNSILHKDLNSDYCEKIGVNSGTKCEKFTNIGAISNCASPNGHKKDCSKLIKNSLQKIPGKCACDSADTFGSCSDFYECSKDNYSTVSSLNSSLGSLRRRWMQSCSSSVDEACYEEPDNFKSKTRTKLGMGLVVNLTNNLEDELEKFLFNHTIVIESILRKLQSSIETAYLKKDNFVDLTYNAFISCQQSMYELINGGKYARPMWLTLSGASVEGDDLHVQNKVYSQFHENIKDCKKQDTLNNVKLKFLNDFCDVLVKFDTKDTNFFVSTLLTAVLTHHLSWVTGIAESDISLPQHKLESVIKGLRPIYNPIWAQLNDLNGVLGSPLKSARTVITGCETDKNTITSIIQILTYFIRCYNVVENVYDFHYEEVTNISDNIVQSVGEKAKDFGTYGCEIEYSYKYVPNVEEKVEGKEKVTEMKTINWTGPAEVDVPDTGIVHDSSLRTSENLQNSSIDGVKRSKSCLFRSKETIEKSAELYHNIDELSEFEKVHISNLCERSPEDDSRLYVDEYSQKIKKLIRVPNKAVICHLEQNLSPDEGYDTVDSCTMGNPYLKNECGTIEEKEDDVLFVLGENDALINLNKEYLKESSSVDLNEEQITVDCKSMNMSRSKSINVPISNTEDEGIDKCRTFNNNSEASAGQTMCQENTVLQEHSCSRKRPDDVGNFTSMLHELPMPRISEKNIKKRLDISSVLGGVNDRYNSEQVIQGVTEDKIHWEKDLRRDLALSARNPVLDRNVTEALCIIGDMNSWEVSLFSSLNFTMDRSNFSGVRIGMSQLVADMLESLLHICRIKLPPDFCLGHIEKKLHEIYTKSKSVAELLNTTEMCSIEYLTTRLDISVNDVPLLLSVATTHSPHISSKYGITFT